MSSEKGLGIECRKYEPGDEKSLALLAKAVWGFHFHETYWKWKYLENPSGYNFSYVAVTNDNIVGFVGGMPWRLILMGKELVGGQVTDLMVHPAWRKKAIFFTLNRRSLEEIKARTSLRYGFTNAASFKIYGKAFRHEGFYAPKMQKIIDIKPFVWQGLKQRKGVEFNRIVNLIPKILSSKKDMPLRTDLVIRKMDLFDASADQLWERERVRMRYSIVTIRDSKYLNWRYIRHPQLRYMVFGAEENGKLSGFVVLRCEKKEGIMRGLIIDLLVDPDQEMTAGLLIGESLKFFRSQKVAVVNTWMFKHNPIYGLLRNNGFLTTSDNRVMIPIQSLSPDISSDYLRDTHNWYLTMGDCEVL